MSYKELHTKYAKCIQEFMDRVNTIQNESSTYVKLSNQDLEVTTYSDITKHYIHSMFIDDIILQ